MDYIYAKLDDNLVNINRIEYIRLERCTVEHSPLELLEIGDYYLETKIIDSDKIIYTDLSALNRDNKAISSKLEQEILDRTTACNTLSISIENEAARTDNMINQLNEEMHSQFTQLNKVLVDSINAINDDIEEERTIREESDNTIQSNLDAESKRVDGMINEVNEKIKVIVDQINQKIADTTATINTSIDNESKERLKQDTLLNERITKEINDLKESSTTSLANLTDIVNQNKSQINERVDNEVASLSSTISSTKQELQSNIDTVNTDLQNKLTETVTATESLLNTKIDAETRRAEAAEQDLQSTIDTTNTNLSDEVDRAIKKEAELDTAIKTETSRAMEVETTLSTNLAQEVSDRRADTTSLTNSIQTEKTRAEKAEKTLQSNIDTLTTSTNSNIETLTDRIAAEETRASEAETTLDNSIKAEAAERATAIAGVKDLVSKEVTRATEAETTLSGNITTLSSNLSSLNSNLTTEIADRKAADVTLEQNISTISNNLQAETNRASQAEEKLRTDLSKDIETEAQSRAEADNNLSQRLDNLEGKTTRLYYGEGTLASPTATEIQSFITNLEGTPYTPPYSGIAVVVKLTDENTYHIWHYYENLSAWKDDGVDLVNTFTNTFKGIIQGTTSTGYISADNGFGKVNGWDTLNSTVASNYTTLNNKIDTSVSTINNTVSSLSQRLNKKINDETTRATAAENLLSSNLTTSLSTVNQTISTLCTNLTASIAAETDRATKKENGIISSLSTETQGRIDGDNTLSAAITKEVSDRKQAITSLSESLTASTTSSISSLNTKIDAEIDRATKKEAELDTAIKAETSRATEVETTLENEFVNGTKKVKSAETADKANSVAWVDVTGKPTIPTKVSQLENDKEYVNNAEVMNRYYIGVPNLGAVTYRYFRIAHLHFTGTTGETAVVNVTMNHGWNFSESQHASYRIEIHSEYDHPENGTSMGALIMRMQTYGGDWACNFYVVWTAPAICDLYVDISNALNEWYSATAMVFGNLESDSNTHVVGVDSIPTAGSDGYPYVSGALTASNLVTKAEINTELESYASVSSVEALQNKIKELESTISTLSSQVASANIVYKDLGEV